MFKYVLSTAALAALASAIVTPVHIGNFTINFAGNHTRPAKSALQGACAGKSGSAQKSDNVCGIEQGGFHYICNTYEYSDAAAACTDHGWRLAVLDDENKLDAQSVLAQCSFNYFVPAWIASFNGLEGDECAVAVPFGVAVNGFPEEVCEVSLPVLCQDIPIVTVTDPIPVATTTVNEILTSTIAVLPTCPGEHLKPCPRKNENSDFVLIDTLLPFLQAECACNQLGLKLADLNITNFLDASNELWSSLGARKHAWIHSWNGDVYEEDDCLALWTGSTGPNGAIAVPQSCEQRKPVLCQRKPRHHHHHCPCKPHQHDCHCPPHHRHHHHQILLEKDNDFEVEEVKHGEDVCKGGDCPKVCHHRVGNIRVVQKAVGAYEADEVCRHFGWNLLDMNEHNQYKVAALLKKCGEEEDGNSMWIRSFDAVDGAACILASQLSCKPAKKDAAFHGWPALASFVFTADLCAEIGDLYVLCEKSCEPVETGTGTFEGTITTTTTTSGFTITDVIYTSTVYTTVTLLQ